ncbi:unnamed protein product [Mytilus edulis]|uniref:Tc1-like transposase DDE domain-containing protein n=1 Tax=Mytilus edulis TaxID=6550 RepID=A0A8S3SXA1_MYTED|nr:unnamed protein product [Mytilus edulis]
MTDDEFLKQSGSLENKERTGRPNLLTPRDTRKLCTTVKSDRKRPLHEITAVFNESREEPKRTVQRKLYEEGFKKRVVKKSIRIRAANVKKRLAWCKLARHKTVEDYWRRVIYSDECKVEIGMDNRVLVWRRPGEEWTPPCLNPGRGSRLSLMIWGCITYEGVGTITVVTGNINALKYIEIVDNFVWPVIARHFPADNYIYQDDNAPVHRAKIVKDYMEQNQLHGMEWPAQSPDLNIIENMWRKIKIELQKQAHNITTKAQMETAIRDIWTNISLEFIRKLYDSIPRRLRLVIRAKGNITKY